MFSYLRTLTKWHCPHSPDAAAAINPYLLAVGPTVADLQQRVYCCGAMQGQTDGRMDRQTDIIPFREPCSAYYAGSANKARRVKRPASAEFKSESGKNRLVYYYKSAQKAASSPRTDHSVVFARLRQRTTVYWYVWCADTIGTVLVLWAGQFQC